MGWVNMWRAGSGLLACNIQRCPQLSPTWMPLMHSQPQNLATTMASVAWVMVGSKPRTLVQKPTKWLVVLVLFWMEEASYGSILVFFLMVDLQQGRGGHE